MKYKGSKIANSIDKEYRKEKEWKKKLIDRKRSITILDEHLVKPLIIKEEEK